MSPKTNTAKTPTEKTIHDRTMVLRHVLLDLEEISVEACAHLRNNMQSYGTLPVKGNIKKTKAPKVPKLTKTNAWTIFYKEKVDEAKGLKGTNLSFDDHQDLRTKVADEWKEADKEEYQIKASEVNLHSLDEWVKQYENRFGMTDDMLGLELRNSSNKENKDVEVYIKKHIKRDKLLHMLGCAGLTSVVRENTSNIVELRKNLLQYYRTKLV